MNKNARYFVNCIAASSAGCRFGFPPDCLRPADGQSPAICNDNLQFYR